MSVRVNLLPAASRERARATRQRGYLLGSVAAVVVLLAGVHVWVLGTVEQARTDRDAAQAEVQAVQRELTDMAAYAELDREHAEAETVLSTALSGEISFAGILQDVAVSVPDDIALTNLELTRIGDPVPGTVVIPAAARLSVGGEALHGAAPGVEHFLWQLGQLSSVTDPYTSNLSAIEDEPEAVSFTVEADLTDEVYTQRYATGLPKDLR
ncbi:MAG: hypothetical protein WD378_00860 [Egicoccus sp.]